ncbi:ATP-grasp fold amidoligase family protein [Janibacter sp. YB324]|uniref:ATP-grasp fold amidoligase family protein n=1 Tax=Janibacter sp. YB324 TaxID=2761047 RepID=UPI00162593E6|nr:ATP-grasp fold amidoligase family protein [Janibacter sp. YB324]QNF93472.1 hypothetical protein H7A72_11925 [Janibacter sp. YB324]
MVIKQMFHRLPPVTRRDAVIAALMAERGRPSFFYKLRESKRLRLLDAPEDSPAPVWELNDKAAGYAFARSHGVPIPRVYGQFAGAEEIDWDGVPDRFVVKVTCGTVAQAVWPLAADGDGYRDLLSGAPDVISRADLTARVDDAMRADEPATVLLEEFLPAPDDSPLSVPPDYKLHCFHGAVGMIAVIGRTQRAGRRLASRYFAPDGTDLGNAAADTLIDSRLPSPPHLDDLVAAGRTLSEAIRSPYVRIDMYDTHQGICFGEITPDPGGNHVMRADVDRHLGELWEIAQHRLEQRAIGLGIRGPEYGPHGRDIVAPRARRRG